MQTETIITHRGRRVEQLPLLYTGRVFKQTGDTEGCPLSGISRRMGKNTIPFWRNEVTDIYERILSLKEAGKGGVLVTVVERRGSTPSEPGMKMLVTTDGNTYGTVGGGTLENHAIEQAKQLLASRKTVLQKYSLDDAALDEDAVSLPMVCGGSVTLFYESIGTGLSVFIFGAGHVGGALAGILAMLGYTPTVIDSRKEILDPVEAAVKIPVDTYAEAGSAVRVPEGSYLVICTHSHEYDYQVLKTVYTEKWNPAYVGVVASRKKAAEIMDRLYKEVGKNIGTRFLYMPVGLDIGGRSAHEIAVSIVSEMQSVRYGKKTPHLRIT